MAHLYGVKRVALTLLPFALTMVIAGAAVGQSNVHRSALPDSYALARKCFVANSHAMGVREDAGDRAGAARYEAGTRASFEAAQVVAVALGYSGSRMQQDFIRTREEELERMMRDAAYFRSVVAACRSAGLMPTA